MGVWRIASGLRPRARAALGLSALVLVVVASRVPFLLPGYGRDNDGWAVAVAARSISLSGEYEASRLPGFPVHELGCALLWRGGPLAVNGATAAFSAVAALFFALTLRRLGCREYLLGGAALAFTPIVYGSSACAMDYMWALACMLAALYLALLERPALAGVLLGLAVGCRITSMAMLLPLGIVVGVGRDGQVRYGPVVRLAAAACLVAAAAFAPVAATYGPGFFTFYGQSWSLTYFPLRLMTLRIWGRVGLLAIGAGLAWRFVARRGESRAERAIPSEAGGMSHVIAWSVAIALYVAAFLALPHEPEYLIPAVPFVLLVLGRVLDRRCFRLVCLGIAVAPFVSLTRGEMLRDHSLRVAQWQESKAMLCSTLGSQEKLVVVSHFRMAHFRMLLAQGVVDARAYGLVARDVPVSGPIRVGKVEYVYLLGPGEAERYAAAGFRILALPDPGD